MRRNRVLVGALFAVAAAALLPATTLASPNIHIGIQIGTPPQLVVVPQTPVYYAPALPYNYFFYGGQYYLFHNGIWHFAPTHNGPWAVIAVEYLPRPILAVPVRYYRAPPGHWKKHRHAPPRGAARGRGEKEGSAPPDTPPPPSAPLKAGSPRGAEDGGRATPGGRG